jgi:anti-anti-sigma factor
MIECRSEIFENWAVVYVMGEIDALTCGAFQQAVQEILNGGKHILLIDMEGVAYISSAGLRVLLSTAQQLYGTGRLAASRVNPDVMEILDMAGFRNIIEFYKDPVEAEPNLARKDNRHGSENFG